MYDTTALNFPLELPLPPEEHVATWEKYLEIGGTSGVWETLSSRLVQLQFPIRPGMKASDEYRAAVRQGKATADLTSATGLVLEQSEQLQLRVHQSVAGAIPVLITPNRADFVSLVRAFTAHNEPVEVPDSMGACMVAGYNNWDRIRAYRAQWEAKNGNHSDFLWQMEFRQRLLPQKHLYQDRFMILGDGPYSGVKAADMGLDEVVWRNLSLRIRLEHECTHYFTKRLFGVMRTHIFDEILADYAGIVAAAGRYRADWFLRFMGLEAYPTYREGGRLQNYIGDLSRTSDNFKKVKVQLKAATETLEQFEAQEGREQPDFERKALTLLALGHLTLSELASPQGNTLLHQVLDTLKERQRGKCL